MIHFETVQQWSTLYILWRFYHYVLTGQPDLALIVITPNSILLYQDVDHCTNLKLATVTQSDVMDCAVSKNPLKTQDVLDDADKSLLVAVLNALMNILRFPLHIWVKYTSGGGAILFQLQMQTFIDTNVVFFWSERLAMHKDRTQHNFT